MKRFVLPFLCSLSMLAASTAYGQARIAFNPSKGDFTIEDDDTSGFDSASGFKAGEGAAKALAKDNDDPGFDVTSPFEIEEGATESLAVALATQPQGRRVTVDISKSGSGDVSVSPSKLIFLSTNWNTPQNLTVRASGDDDADDDIATISLLASGADYGGVGTDIRVIVEEKDTPGLIFFPSETTGQEGSKGNVQLTEGGSGTSLAVKLAARPSGGNVDVNLKSPQGLPVSISPAKLTFSPSNWSTNQTVTLSAGEDDNGYTDTGEAAVTASGADYGDVDSVVRITINDNDTNGLVVSPTTLSLDESGASKNLTVKLSTQPTAIVNNAVTGGVVNVSVTVPSELGHVSASPSSLRFTSSNWNSARTITLVASDDDNGRHDKGTVTLSASGADYDNIDASVSLAVTDDDRREFLVSAKTGAYRNGSLSLTEGDDAVMEAKLSTQPVGGNVTINLTMSKDSDASVSPSSLTFTPAEWNQVQTFTVSAAEDDDGVRDQATLSLSAKGADYGAVTASIAIEMADNDTANIIRTPAGDATVKEGESITFSISLSARPPENLTVIHSISQYGQYLVRSAAEDDSFSFTPDNWNTPQTATYLALWDTDDEDNTRSFYTAFSEKTVPPDTLTITENDKQDPLVFSSDTLNIDEGQSATFTVRLGSKPLEDPSVPGSGGVAVTLTKTGSREVSISPRSLAFTSSGWNTPQTVTVRTSQDIDTFNDDATISFSASGANFGQATDEVTVNVLEKGLVVSASDLDIVEGNSKDFNVKLSRQPSGAVTVNVASSSRQASVSPASLEFDQTNWNTDQTVTVSIAEDDDAADGRFQINLFAVGANYAGVSSVVEIKATENDSPGLNVNSALSVTEGDDGALLVKLTAEPTGGNVTVALTKSGSGDVSVSPASLIFSGSNWNTSQTVTVSATEDDDAAVDIAALSLDASGANYADIGASVQIDVVENDAAGLITSPSSSLGLTEGSNSTFTVRLAARPTGGNVTVTLTTGGSDDVTLSPASLTFTPSQWSTPKTVTANAAEDDDGSNDSASVSLGASGADYANITGSLDVTVTDNDSPGLSLSTRKLTVAEGDNNDFTVRLAVQPSGNVRITLAVSGNGDVSLSPTTLDFTSSNWSQARTVTVNAEEDADAADDSASVSLTASGADYGNVSDRLSVDVSDNETRALIIVPSATLGLTEGGDKDITVKLSAKPTGAVTVDLTTSGSDDVSLSKTSLSFSADDWNTPQVVTVSADEDNDGINDSASVSLRASGADFSDITGSVDISVSDNDSPGLTLSSRTLDVSEGGKGRFTVQLAVQPSGNVSIALTTSGSGDASLSPTSLTFTTENWSSAKNVDVSAAEDNDAIDDITNVKVTASGADYDGITGNIQIQVKENDRRGLTITPASNLGLTEGGKGEFTVRLNAQPTANVSVDLATSGSGDISLSPGSLTFGVSDWNIPKTVTASAAEDDDVEEDVADVSLTASGAGYGGITGSLKITVTDSGTPGLTLSSTKVTIDEGSDGVFTVKLATQPSAAVTLSLIAVGNGDVGLDTDAVAIGRQNTLIFTRSNWDSARTVTVSAAEDNDGAADSGSIALRAAGANYAGVGGNVQISITDNDTPGLSVTPRDLGITEGSQGSFAVKLSAQPTGGDVTVDLTRSGSLDLTLSATSLLFTRSDWSTEQTVTVFAAEDTDGIAENANISLSASGADFGGVTDSIEVEITDNDTPGLSLSHLTLPVFEGGSGTLLVQLAIQPSGIVSVALSVSLSEDVSLSPSSLTFTDADWDIPQAITISAAEDDDIAADTAIVSLAASGADYDGITGSVRVDVSDNETRGFDINPSTLGLTEGSDGIFVVRLSSQPSWNVSVALNASGSEDITISPTSIAFDPANWNAAQTIAVKSAEDQDLDDDTATVFLAASGADYGDVTGSMQISVTDNDTPGLTISPSALTMNEGGQRDFEVALAVRPSAEISLDLASSNPDASLSPSRLTFTPSDWSIVRTVTVAAAEDDDFDDDSVTVSLTASGGEYEGIVGNLSAWILDNDISQITLSPSALTIVEGSDNTFTARLKTRPIDADTVLNLAVDGDPGITLDPETLTFTVSNWDKDQTVTVSAAEDENEVGESASVLLSGILNGERINGSVQVSVSDSNAEENAPPPTIHQALIFPATSWLSVDEGSSATFTVRANEQPPQSVVVTLSGSGSTDVSFDTDAQVNGNQNVLTFTPDDWNTDRTVRVDAAEDEDAASDRANISLFGAIAGIDANFVISGDMPVEVVDNDTPGMSALPAALTIDESSSAAFAVRLETRPLGNVVLSFDNGGSDTALSPPNLVFNPSNWRRARNVTVSGVADVDTDDDGPVDISISAKGGGYDGIGAKVQVRVEEATRASIPVDETPGLVITGTPVDIDEGGTNDFYLRLRNRPTDEVTITLGVTGENVSIDTDALRDGNQNRLTFAPSNFNGARLVRVFAQEDDNTSDEVERLSFSATGGNYDGLEAAASVSADDNDSPSLIASHPEPADIDTAQAKFTVHLSTPPTRNVRVAMSLPFSIAGISLDTDIATSGNQSTLLFRPSNFSTPQSVYLSVDDDFQSKSVSIDLLARGGNYDGVSDIVTVLMGDIDAILGRGDEYSDRGDPRYWWPVQTMALAIPPPSVGDSAVISIGCRQDGDCEVFLDCSAQSGGTSFRGGLSEPVPAWGIARLSTIDIANITGSSRSGTGRLGCALHSEDRISTQVWTRSGDGVLVNNSAFIPSVDIEGVHRADIESIPGPDEMDLSNIRIRCRAPYSQACTSTTIVCFDDGGNAYNGDLGTIERHTVRHLQTSELADIIDHRWKGSTLSCELRSDAPFTVQILTRTGGGGALVNNNAASSLIY
ncbi:MAG: hypothetical protein ISN28_02060 [Ectothiorhodospiraceae bacterium AqS1]|nr:hypothetical protein [Ectothiorhodospiraceae bacterium AqS1]